MWGPLLFITISIVSSVSKEAVSSALDNLHYVGCFDPGYSLRQRYHHHMPAVTLTTCVQYCQALRTTYAAVEASDNYCYCGNDIAEESVQRNNTFCNTPCPDDAIRTCGGIWLISAYSIRGAARVDIVDKVDFLVGLSTGVRRYRSKDVLTYETIMTTEEWAYSVDYHLSKNYLFAHTKNTIVRSPMESTRRSVSNNTVVKTVPPKSEGFVVDWVHDRIYMADYRKPTQPSIVTFGLDGENEQTVVTLEELSGKNLNRMEIDPYRGKLFWLADNMIMSVDTSGTDFNSNVTRQEMSVRAIALDLKQRRVYFVANLNMTTSLFSVDYDGEEERQHFTVPQLKSVYGLSVLGDKVFWVNYANIRDVVYEAPINLTQANDVKSITTIDRAVWHMRVMHPSLQSRPSLDSCMDKGCSHSCVHTGVASVACSCPPGQRLLRDGVSCQEVKGSATPGVTAGVLLPCLLLVFAVVLTALAMMYLLNKHWSHLESKLFGIRYSKGVGDKGPGSTEDDHVNLV